MSNQVNRFVRKISIDLDLNALNNIVSILALSSINDYERRSVANDFLSLEADINTNFADFRIRTTYQLVSLIAKSVSQNPNLSIDDLGSTITANFLNDDELEVIEEELGIAENKLEYGDVDLLMVSKYLRNRKNFIGLFKHRDELVDMINRVEMNDFGGDLEEFVQDFCEVLDVTRKSLSPTLSEDEAEDFMLGVSTEAHRTESIFDKSIRKLNNPANVLKTGLQYLNMQLGEANGFELGREYLFGGPAGSGKSLFLMRCMYWIWKYNKVQFDEETGKRNLIIYISGENSQVETAQRLYEMFFPEDYVLSNPYKNQKPAEILSLLEAEGFNDDGGFALAFLYRRNKSINTRDLENIIESYSNAGYCVKAVVYDYTKRINPVERRNDSRLDLGAVVDEFATISKIFNLALISAVQLNGEAIAAIEESLEKGNLNVLEKIGSKAVGESKLIIENTDFLFLVYIESSNMMKRAFQTVKVIKQRGKQDPNAPKFFAQPFLNWKLTPHLLDDYESEKPLGLLDIGIVLEEHSLQEAACPSGDNSHGEYVQHRASRASDNIEKAERTQKLNKLLRKSRAAAKKDAEDLSNGIDPPEFS